MTGEASLEDKKNEPKDRQVIQHCSTTNGDSIGSLEILTNMSGLARVGQFLDVHRYQLGRILDAERRGICESEESEWEGWG